MAIGRLTVSDDGAHIELPMMMAASDAAAYFGLTVSAIHLWLADGTIHALRIGDLWRIPTTSLIETIEAGITLGQALGGCPRRPAFAVEERDGKVRVPTLLTVHQLSEHLSVSDVTVRRQILSGHLPAVRIRGRWYVLPADARALFRQAQVRNARRRRSRRRQAR